jgi:hypothetical protein
MRKRLLPDLTAVLLVLTCLAGCTSTTVEIPGGTRITRRSFLTNPTIGPMQVKHGDTEFRLESYGHNQTDVAAAVTAAAIKAVAK